MFILFFAFIAIFISLYFLGICDCCDGSDEIGFLGYSSMISKEQISGTFLGISNHCEDTCEDDLLFMKQKSLIFHKNLKDGLTAKKKIIAAYELKKKKENKYVIF